MRKFIHNYQNNFQLLNTSCSVRRIYHDPWRTVNSLGWGRGSGDPQNTQSAQVLNGAVFNSHRLRDRSSYAHDVGRIACAPLQLVWTDLLKIQGWLKATQLHVCSVASLPARTPRNGCILCKGLRIIIKYTYVCSLMSHRYTTVVIKRNKKGLMD